MKHLWPYYIPWFALAALMFLVSATDTDTTFFGRFLVIDDYDTEPTCATSAGDGDICAADDIEAEDDLDVGDAAAVGGTLTVTGAATFSSSVGVVSQTVGIDFSTFRIYDNIDAFLDQAAADDDDLTLIQGSFGTVATTIETIDCGGLNDTTQYAAFWFSMPPAYVSGSTVNLTANAGMVTTVADQSATIDFQCYVPDYANEDATVSTDLITTAAQSVNSTTFADKSFVVDDDASGYELNAGTIVQCRAIFLCDDDGNAGAGITIRMNRLDLVISS